MPLEAPNLDDRRFEDIFREARALIPRYMPEWKWTDWNESDPGITLLQLFAWMSEMLLFRLNQVPDHHYIKFLQLLGIERKPAMPAHAEITFTLTSENLPTVDIPKGTRVAAAAAGEGEPVIFETDETLHALGAKLKEVQTFDGSNFAIQTQANTVTGEHYPAFGPNAPEGSALYLGFASSQPFPTVEISLVVYLFNPLGPTERACDLEEQQIVPPAQIVWEHWNGAQFSPLNLIRDETRAFTRSGHILFLTTRNFPKAKLGKLTTAKDEELYWIRARLVRATYEMPPELDEVAINTVPATAAQTVQDEVLGSSNGRPDQSFIVRNRPVFAEAARMEQIREEKRHRRERSSLEEVQAEQARIREQERRKGFLLEVDEEAGFAPWEEVDDFFESGADDRHYMLNRATGEVKFGNGERGKIPLAGVNNIVIRFYRYGGGASGNAGADTITSLQTSVPFVASATNKRAAEGGTDEEPLEDAKLRGPREIKARGRAITPEDFELLAMQTPGARIRRARAFPLHHPQFPDIEVPGVVTVVVVPDSKASKPVPSESTLRAVCDYLNKHRLLTTEVFVSPPQYTEVSIKAQVFAKPESDLAEVRRSIEERLLAYFHPLTGGSDGHGWEPGADIFFSEIFRVILGVEGVKRIEDLRIILDGEQLGAAEDARIPDGFLVFSQAHPINVDYDRSQ